MTTTYFHVTASISLVFSFITYLMILLRWVITKRQFPWILVSIMISDVLTAIGYLLGTPDDHTLTCSIQGYLTTTFPICSVCWTTVVVYNLYLFCQPQVLPTNTNPVCRPSPTAKSHNSASTSSSSHHQQHHHHHGHHHHAHISFHLQIILWLVCLLYGVLPLTTSRYGCAGGDSDCWCYVTHRSNPNSIWTVIWYYSFYIILWISFFIYLLLCIYIFSYIRRTDQKIHAFFLSPRVFTLAGYPLVIILSWLPISIIEILSWKDVYGLEEFGYICLGLQGTFASIVYFMTNTSHWKCCQTKKIKIIHEPILQLPRIEPPKAYEINGGEGGGGGGGVMAPTKLVYQTKLESPLILEDLTGP